MGRLRHMLCRSVIVARIFVNNRTFIFSSKLNKFNSKMTELELQTEEIETLTSIYEGDTCFKQLNNTTFQYKYGEDDTEKSFIIEISWGASYPNEMPGINLATYYNRNISQSFKSKIVAMLTAEGENWLGCGMTYTLFECVKEQLQDLLDELEEEAKNATMNQVSEDVKTIKLAPLITTQPTEIAAKKEQMTKTQKRRMWERTDNKGQLQRGWNWVDIIRHLSQTGHSKDDTQQLVQGLAPPPNN